MLSLLVALIAVVGSTAGVLRSIFHTPSAHIGFAVQGAISHQIAVLVYNDGDRLGTLFGGALTLPDGRDVFVAPSESVGPMLVPANSSELLHFMTLDATGKAPKPAQQCKFALMVGDEYGRRVISERSVQCDEISGFFD